MTRCLIRPVCWQGAPAQRILFYGMDDWRGAKDSLSPDDILSEAPGMLLVRPELKIETRPHETIENASLILLAGGKSSRMGRDKASLPILGTTLLELQLDKARLLGISDVLVSGSRDPIPGARVIPDVYPDRGPLGGLHACLVRARHPQAIVLTVDMPFLPPSILAGLLDRHRAAPCEITLAQHAGKWEPLVGIYAAHLHARIPPMIECRGAAVRRLIEVCDTQYHEMDETDAIWANWNTPEDASF